MAILDMDMRMATMTTTTTMMMTITSLMSNQEICLLVVRSQVWQFRILQTEMIPERSSMTF
jgi:hypothetical protein